MDPISTDWDKSAALARLAGNEALLKKIVTLFLQQIPDDMQKIQQGLEEDNIEQIVSTAHAVKGVAGNLGAIKLQDIAATLQHKAQQHELAELEHLFTQMTEAVEQITQQFNHYLNS